MGKCMMVNHVIVGALKKVVSIGGYGTMNGM